MNNNNNLLAGEVAATDEVSNGRFPRPDYTRLFVDEAMKMFKAAQDRQKSNFDREFDKLKLGQNRTRQFNKAIKIINTSLNPDGSLTIVEGSELHLLLQAAAQDTPSSSYPPVAGADGEPPFDGIPIDTNKLQYTKEEVDRLLETIRISVDDMNVINEMQLQTVNRIVTQQQELFQIMKALLKPLHDTKVGMARAIAGR